MSSISNHTIVKQAGRKFAGLAVVLSALLFWSNVVLAAWCSDPALHWLHPGQDQIGLQSKSTLNHRVATCKSMPAKRLQTFPTRSVAGEDDRSSSGAAISTGADYRVTGRQESGSRLTPAIVTDIAAPPLYLIYQRLLLPFAV